MPDAHELRSRGRFFTQCRFGRARRLAALLARAAQQHVVAVDGDAEPVLELVDGPPEAGVVEGDELTALGAEEVMVVLAAGLQRLKASLALTDEHALGEAALDQEIEGGLDAGAGDGPPVGAQPVLDLRRAQRAPLLAQQIDDRVARATPAVAAHLEICVHVADPLQAGHARTVASMRTRIGIRLILILVILWGRERTHWTPAGPRADARGKQTHWTPAGARAGAGRAQRH